MSDQTHHSAAARNMLVPAVPALTGHTEEYVPTRPLATQDLSDKVGDPTTQSTEQAAD